MGKALLRAQLALQRRDRLALGGLLLLALALCLPWLGAPDPVGDLELSARRCGGVFTVDDARRAGYRPDDATDMVEDSYRLVLSLLTRRVREAVLLADAAGSPARPTWQW